MSNGKTLDSIIADVKFSAKAEAHTWAAAILEQEIKTFRTCCKMSPTDRDAVEAELRRLARAHIKDSERVYKKSIRSHIIEFISNNTEGASDEVKKKILVKLGLRKR